MDNKKEALKSLEAAIDKMDMTEIEAELENLRKTADQTIAPEEPALFSARIRQLQKENQPMKKIKKPITVAIVAAVLVLMSITVYASGVLNRFMFTKGDQLTTVHTTEAMTEKEAEEIANSFELPSDPSQTMEPSMQDLSFSTVEQAEKEMNMKLPLPKDMADFSLDSASGSIIAFGDNTETKTAWLNYSDSSGSHLGVTVTKEIIDSETATTGATTHDIDEGSLGSYTTPAGVKYTTLTESDPNNSENIAHIATTWVGEYEYALVFVGFDQAQQEAVINSADLSVYR